MEGLRKSHNTITELLRLPINSFGASLSYASQDGLSGAKSSQVLSDTMIEDDAEVIILSDKSCDDGGCGYTRPGGVSYRKPCASV